MAGAKIQAFCNKKGIALKKLVTAVGTTQQQVYRIDTGKQPVRFDLAAKICAILEAPMESVFPETKRAIDKLRKKGLKPIPQMFEDEDFQKAMERANVDMDPAMWSMKYRFRGGAKGSLPISGIEKNRLQGAAQRAQGFSDPFITFDSEDWLILLNLDHLIFCQFMFDSAQLAPATESENETADSITVFLVDSDEPLDFEVDCDHWDRDDPEDMGQIGHLIFTAEHSNGDNEDTLHFGDVNGEEAYFRARDVAMFQIPHWVVEPDLLTIDEDEEDEAEMEGPAGHS